MQNVTIVGLGLIGGSLGLALKRWSADNENALRITGFDTDIEHQQLAKKMKAVDDIPWSLPDAITDADIVILAIPVGAMKQAFEDIAPHLKFNAIVTDTGSTKTEVLEWAKILPAHVSFVGAHPMAGGSRSLDAASADLFNGASWIICPSSTASELAIQTVLGLVAATNGEPFFVEPQEHDAYVAGISHLPFVVASSLVKTTMTDGSWRDMKTLASTGFRDTTRVALGSPEMHRDIVLTNRDAIGRWVDSMIKTLQEFRAELVNEDEEAAKAALGQFFKDTQELRQQADLVQPRSAEMAAEDTNMAGSGMLRSMLFGGFGNRNKDDKSRR
ncbi:MAG: prephenate dehydrogenase/arogenate dehydrogenase family protein [Thermomicrobiales bacterium]|nr:prephenate dehydrogenase/arogenate dehydrogenase family protein [Thermomicrobiales bacterium]